MLDRKNADALLLTSLCIFLIAAIIVVIVASLSVYSNKQECYKMSCDRGEPVLIEGDCRCVEKAK